MRRARGGGRGLRGVLGAWNFFRTGVLEKLAFPLHLPGVKGQCCMTPGGQRSRRPGVANNWGQLRVAVEHACTCSVIPCKLPPSVPDTHPPPTPPNHPPADWHGPEQRGAPPAGPLFLCDQPVSGVLLAPMPGVYNLFKPPPPQTYSHGAVLCLGQTTASQLLFCTQCMEPRLFLPWHAGLQ
jgi:hypothetical protein